MPGPAYRLSDLQRQYVTNMFFFDPTKEKLGQLSKDRYASLVNGPFKVAETGIVTAEDIRARQPVFSQYRYFQEEYEGKLYRRDKTFSTRVVASDCSNFYLSGNSIKITLQSGILATDGSRLNDSQLLEVIGRQSLEPLGLTARIQYDRFEKRFKVATPVYNRILLRGSVDDSGKVVLVQLYADLIFNESWGFIRSALDTDGRSHEVTKISTNTDCSSRIVGCMLTETVGVTLDQSFLEGKRSGFEIKAFGTKEQIIKVPGPMVEAFLAGLERAKKQERDASN